MGGKSSTQETKQTNEPPAWAKPLLEKTASEASRLYGEGSGYNPNPITAVAQKPQEWINGANLGLTMTGAKPTITADSMYNTKQVQDAQQMIANQQIVAQQKAAARAAADAQAAAAKKGLGGKRQPAVYTRHDTGEMYYYDEHNRRVPYKGFFK